MMILYDKLRRQVDVHPCPLVFATISGAHLYGFPSADSDFDLRGVHLLPVEQVVGLNPGEETVEKSGVQEGMEVDLVTHDAKKFFQLMLKKNGYVLEQLFSPLVVHTTPEHEELKSIAKDCITRHHAHHYLGFADTQWKLFRKEDPPRVKPLLYVYRVLLTGIHLMQSGEVEANLLKLNDTAKLPYIDDLVERKLGGPERGHLEPTDLEIHEKEYWRLTAELEAAAKSSHLSDESKGTAALNALCARLTKYRSGAPWKPQILLMNANHMSRDKAREEVIRMLSAFGESEPKEGWHAVELKWKGEPHSSVSFSELVQEARTTGTIARLQDALDRRDSVFGHSISDIATPEYRLTINTSFAGSDYQTQGPGRSAFSERDLAEDILYYRRKTCEDSNEYDFRKTCRYFRAYLFASVSIIDAFINRHILLAEHDGFSSPEFDELKSSRNATDRFRLWFKVCSEEDPQRFFESQEWCHFQEIRTKRNEITHVIDPIGAYSLRDIQLLLNKVRTGVGGLLFEMRRAHRKPTLGFIERLRTAPLIDFCRIGFRADGQHSIEVVKAS